MRLLTVLTVAALAISPGLGCPLMALAWSQPPASGASHSSQAFSAFWPSFRDVLLVGDVEAVTAMARLPLEVRGELDSDPVRRVGRSDIAALLVRVLAADTGLSMRERVTNRMLVERVGPQPRPMPGVVLTNDAARVGAFTFERTVSGWRLSRLHAPND